MYSLTETSALVFTIDRLSVTSMNSNVISIRRISILTLLILYFCRCVIASFGCRRVFSIDFSISHLISLKCHHQNESAQNVFGQLLELYKEKCALLARDDDDENKQ